MNMLTTEKLTMSSREISELTGIRQDNVKRTMIALMGKGVINFTQFEENANSAGRPPVLFLVNKRDSYVVVAQLSPEFTAKLVDRWQELEEKQLPVMPAWFESLSPMAKIAIEDLDRQRIEAIETKAEIGHRREATAMNTASQAVKKANKLEIELDKSKEYCTIKRMEMLCHGQKFKWRELKSASTQLELPPIDVFDSNYGTVKSYHRDVWIEAYGLEF